MKRIILGSNSPRRRELLGGLGYEFTVDTLNTFKETPEPLTPPHLVPVHMAEGKSHGFHRTLAPDEVLITADTVVIVGNEVLGKPHSREEAFRMLRELSGRSHEVVTAVTIRDCDREETFTDTTVVHFADLSDDEIDGYIDNCKPFDKAGAYGIQEWIGYAGISGIEGSFYNVMGFPCHKVYHELKKFI
ncbi:MAG: Maf family nucleotide pyrophosphatase [Bacteroidales bacterium]|nr:Maf family nucleotide pyrophosphatase [Bacteroidales bacterium]